MSGWFTIVKGKKVSLERPPVLSVKQARRRRREERKKEREEEERIWQEKIASEKREMEALAASSPTVAGWKVQYYMANEEVPCTRTEIQMVAGEFHYHFIQDDGIITAEEYPPPTCTKSRRKPDMDLQILSTKCLKEFSVTERPYNRYEKGRIHHVTHVEGDLLKTFMSTLSQVYYAVRYAEKAKDYPPVDVEDFFDLEECYSREYKVKGIRTSSKELGRLLKLNEKYVFEK